MKNLGSLLRERQGTRETFMSLVWFGLVGFFTSSSTTRLYRGRAPRQSVWQFYVLSHMRLSWETMTSVSAGHIILTPTQPVGSGRPQRESNPGPPHQESRALPTELPRTPPPPPPLRLCHSLRITQLYIVKEKRRYKCRTLTIIISTHDFSVVS